MWWSRTAETQPIAHKPLLEKKTDENATGQLKVHCTTVTVQEQVPWSLHTGAWSPRGMLPIGTILDCPKGRLCSG